MKEKSTSGKRIISSRSIPEKASTKKKNKKKEKLSVKTQGSEAKGSCEL